MQPDHITIHLDRSEALVLFSLLAEFQDEDSLLIRHQAERAALWALEATLERVLVEPFQDNYRSVVEEARQSVVKRVFGPSDALDRDSTEN